MPLVPEVETVLKELDFCVGVDVEAVGESIGKVLIRSGADFRLWLRRADSGVDKDVSAGRVSVDASRVPTCILGEGIASKKD